MTTFKLKPQREPKFLRAEMLAKGMNPDAPFRVLGYDRLEDVWVVRQD
jgi:hypothetical protein